MENKEASSLSQEPCECLCPSKPDTEQSDADSQARGAIPVLGLKEFLDKSAIDWKCRSFNQHFIFQRRLEEKKHFVREVFRHVLGESHAMVGV